MELKLGKRVTHLLFENLAKSLGATKTYSVGGAGRIKITVASFNLQNKVNIIAKYSQGTLHTSMYSNTGIGGFDLLPEDIDTIQSFLEAAKSLRSLVYAK